MVIGHDPYMENRSNQYANLIANVIFDLQKLCNDSPISIRLEIGNVGKKQKLKVKIVAYEYASPYKPLIVDTSLNMGLRDLPEPFFKTLKKALLEAMAKIEKGG